MAARQVSGFRSLLRTGLAVALIGLVAACGMPKDPKDTAKRVEQTGVLRVGVAENPPWSGMAGTQATGIEADLVRRFADRIHARIEWVPGGESDLLEDLENFQLDLAIGGFRKNTPWSKKIGLTRPYLKSEVVVGAAPDAPRPDRLKGLSVAVRRGDPAAGWLLEKGARPVPVDGLKTGQQFAAVEDWQLAGLGLRDTGIHLRGVDHVLAAPPGENGWILRIERFLKSQEKDLRGRLAGRATS